MPSEIVRVEGQVREGFPYFSLHHVQYANGTLPLKSQLSGTTNQEITYSVYDLNGDTPATAISTGVLDEDDCWFDSLQNDSWWDNEDDAGYNFRGLIPAAKFPNGAGKYKIEYAATANAAVGGVSLGNLAWEEYVEVVARFDS